MHYVDVSGQEGCMYHLDPSRCQREPSVDLLEQTGAAEVWGSEGRCSRRSHPGGKSRHADRAPDRDLCHKKFPQQLWCIPPAPGPLNEQSCTQGTLCCSAARCRSLPSLLPGTSEIQAAMEAEARQDSTTRRTLDPRNHCPLYMRRTSLPTPQQLLQHQLSGSRMQSTRCER